MTQLETKITRILEEMWYRGHPESDYEAPLALPDYLLRETRQQIVELFDESN